MKLSYRAQRKLRRTGVTLLVLAVVFTLVWLCWISWLERYVVYTRDGAVLDFSASVEELSGEVAVEPVPGTTIGIYYNEGDEAVTQDTSLTQLAGYYIDTDALVQGIEPLTRQLEGLAPGTPVMVDVKSIYGNFYYNTGIPGATTTDSLDNDAMDTLIETLCGGDFYAIARLPAFRDRSYGEKHVESGLPTEEGYLWYDEDSCYWLDPADGGTLSYLMKIVGELKALGFDEVVFTEFRFPEAEEIVYPTETPKSEILAQTAEDLLTTCATETFAVSFQSDDPAFVIPQGRSRLFLDKVEATAVESTVAKVTVEDPLIHLVLLAATNDTRYDSYGVLRPLSSAR